MRLNRLFIAVTLLASGLATADEGMWTFNNFPADKVKSSYGFSPTKEWLERTRLASVRIAGGCSASVVTSSGLVMTNHHCAHHCIEQLSSLSANKEDFVKAGFFAKTEADEKKCPDMEMNQLVEISDVTTQVQAATKGVASDKFNEVQRATIAGIEKECATSDEFRCDVVTLYRGGRYDLYKYRRFQDVRLVFAPELAIAFFGGDPDNFMFPRYDLDLSFLRIYGRDGQPMKADAYLPFSPNGSKDGELTFVSGNPGGTSRSLTIAQLEAERDVRWPQAIARLSEMRGMLTEYQNRGVEQKRHSTSTLFYVENSLKAIKGRQAALANPTFFKTLTKAEQDFQSKINGKAALKKTYAPVWDSISKTTATSRQLRRQYVALEGGIQGDLFGAAKSLVRYAEESGKPNEQRLREFTDSRLPQLKQGLTSGTPIYPELETALMTWSLVKLREDLGTDHPVVKRLFAEKSPEELAKSVVASSKLADKKVRADLFNGGKAAIEASKDPMLELVRSFDSDARAIRAMWEEKVEGPLKQQSELLAKARFEVFGTGIYPDATFTLRLSYGQVKGWDEMGSKITPYTTFDGAFARHTGKDPFALPKSWLDSKTKLALNTPFDVVTTNDITGGNSGSPLFNQQGEVVGLVFDGNIHSLGGEYGFDPSMNRTVAVTSNAILESLEKVYGAKRLVDELKPNRERQTGQP